MIRAGRSLLFVASAAVATAVQIPPMGWMSWEIFRCGGGFPEQDTMAVNETLYMSMTDALVAGGFLKAGYAGIHIDDCWMSYQRDPTTQQLVANSTRFPHGMKALGDYMHSRGVQFGLYTAESTTTCGGYMASQGHEALDASTFADWGVDYLKVDGCGSTSYYPTGYKAMGQALQATGRPITYSCSWPAYLGDNETTKPFDTFIADGCDLWRNWDDIQCSWASLSSIIEHWGTYGAYMKQFSSTGHVHDPDMLLAGNTCISDDEARTQMAIWSIVAAPLIMGNDLRNITASAAAILQNAEAIAVDQDPLGEMGVRLSTSSASEVWARNLSNGDIAVGLFNKGGAAPPSPASCPSSTWNETQGGYLEACGGSAGDISCFSGLSQEDALSQCCSNGYCAGFSYNPADGSGCFKSNVDCGVMSVPGFVGFNKIGFVPPTPSPLDIALNFTMLGWPATTWASVRDIWAQKSLGVFYGGFTASAVPFHGTGFYRLQRVG